MELHPTHTCFDDAVEFVEAMVRAGAPEASELVIVHAVCRAEFDGIGRDYAHAWVEHGDQVFDAFLLEGARFYAIFPRDWFYARRDVQRAIGYSLQAAYRENQRTVSFGPWDPDLLELCVDMGPPLAQRGGN
jgi:hypothetical protein